MMSHCTNVFNVNDGQIWIFLHLHQFLKNVFCAQRTKRKWMTKKYVYYIMMVNIFGR